VSTYYAQDMLFIFLSPMPFRPWIFCSVNYPASNLRSSEWHRILEVCYCRLSVWR
jgi:hypothetical protein